MLCFISGDLIPSHRYTCKQRSVPEIKINLKKQQQNTEQRVCLYFPFLPNYERFIILPGWLFLIKERVRLSVSSPARLPGLRILKTRPFGIEWHASDYISYHSCEVKVQMKPQNSCESGNLHFS